MEQVRPRFAYEPTQGDKQLLKPADENMSSKAKRTYCRGCSSYWVERIVSDAASASTGPEPEIEAKTERIVSDTVSASTMPEPEIDVKTDKPIEKTAIMHKQDNPKAESFHEEARAPKLPMVDFGHRRASLR